VPVGQLWCHSGRKRLHNRPDRRQMRALMNGMGGSVWLMGENSYAGDEFINREGETDTGRTASCFYHGKGLRVRHCIGALQGSCHIQAWLCKHDATHRNIPKHDANHTEIFTRLQRNRGNIPTIFLVVEKLA